MRLSLSRVCGGDGGGSPATKLTSEELARVFDLVAKGSSPKDALSQNPARSGNTIYRAFNVAAQFERLKLESLTSQTVAEIAEEAGYSTTASYVSDVYLKWVSWKRKRSVEDSGEYGTHGAGGDHKDLREWIAENFDKAVIAKEALRHRIRTRLQVAFSDGFIGVIMPTHNYGPLEQDIIRSIERRDPRLQNALSDLDAALRGEDRAGAERAADEISRLVDEWITL